jgi:PAS domain S-box-containing protein
LSADRHHDLSGTVRPTAVPAESREAGFAGDRAAEAGPAEIRVTGSAESRAGAAALGGRAGVRSAGLPDDAPAARWRRGALAAYYVAMMVANLVMLGGVARIVLSLLCGVTAILLVVAASRGSGRHGRGAGRRTGVASGAGAGAGWVGRRLWSGGRGWENLAYLPVAISVAQVAVTGQLHFTTSLLLTLVGVGGAVPSRRIAARAGLLGCVGWVVAVAAEEQLRTPELGYYAAQMGMAALLGVILHEALRRRLWDLRLTRDQLTVVLERFENLFQASPAGVGIADEHGVFVAVNPAFCELVGMPAEELVGASSHAYADPGAESDPAGREVRLVRPDGQVRWTWLTVGRTGVLDRTDTRHWMLIHLHDVTDRHLAQRTVHESDRAAGRGVRRRPPDPHR